MAHKQAMIAYLIAFLLLAVSSQSVEFDIGEVHPDLVGYWEWNSCGRYGNDNHLDYLAGAECPPGSECHCGSRGCALLTMPNANCPSGEMHLQFYGDDGGVLNMENALWINCCEHIWFTQYSCDPTTNLVILDRNVHYAIAPVPEGCDGAGEVKPNLTRFPTISVETTLSPTVAATTIPDIFVSDDSSCPTGSELVTDNLDCRAAAEFYGFNFWGSNPAAPAGCWKYTNGGVTHVFINNHDGNNVNMELLQPFCQTVDTTDGPCSSISTWEERFDFADHVCAPQDSDFDRSELPQDKHWTFSNQFGWFTLTSNQRGDNDYVECRALCERTTRCVTYAFQPTDGATTSGCFLYSETDCLAVLSDERYKIHDLKTDCSLTTEIVDSDPCVITLGNADTPVDGSFEALQSIAATSASSVLNSNVNGAGWHNGINTADSFLAPFQTSFPGNTNRNVPASPDGGVFAGAAAGINDAGTEYQESFYTDIENLEIGTEYTIQFWQSSTADQIGTGNGESRVAQGNEGAWEVHFGDSMQMSPTVTYQGKDQPSTWTQATLSFTATATMDRLEFVSKAISVVGQPQWVIYVLVDGITVHSNQLECPTTTQMDTTTTMVPTTESPDIFVSDDSSCPTGSALVTDNLDCRAAAEFYGFNFWGSNPAAPAGCWKYTNGGVTHVFINNRDGNNVNMELLQPFCETADSTTQMDTTAEATTTMVPTTETTACVGGFTDKIGFPINGFSCDTQGISCITEPAALEDCASYCVGDCILYSNDFPGFHGWCVTMSFLPDNVPTHAGSYCLKDRDIFVSDDSSCPTGSALVTDNLDCRAAAEFYGFNFWGSNPAAPAGCWKYTNGGVTHVFINNRDGNNVNMEFLQPFCETADSTTQMDTTAEATTTIVPTTETTDIFVSDDSSCPAGSALVTDNLDCRAAAEFYGFNFWGSNPAAPAGCWKYTNGGVTHVFINNRDGNNINMEFLQPFCETVDFTTTALPTTMPTSTIKSTPTPTDDPCSIWEERFDFVNHVCAPYHSDFDRSELPQDKLWTFSDQFGWYTYTSNQPGPNDYVECRALCEQTTRCATYAFQPNRGSTGGCFLYSEPDCLAIPAAGGYKIHDHKVDCSLTTTETSTTSAVTTTVDPKKDCGSGKPNYRLRDFSFRYHFEGISGLGPEFGWDLPRACGWLCSQDAQCQAWFFDTSGNVCSLSSDSEIYYDEREPGRVTSGNCEATVSKPECPNGNTLDFLGEGRCAYDSAMLDFPAAGYILKKPKADCLSECELNDDCVGAITAYDYYCAHYLSSDVGMIDAQPSSKQTQWECHAKCHSTRRENECNEFLVDYRIPRDTIYRRERILGNPVDGYYLPAICAKLCAHDPLCKAFTFDTSGNTCNFGNTPQLDVCTIVHCGAVPGRLTSGSCESTDGPDGETSVCPHGFIPHGEHGELNLHNHPTGAWPTKSTIEECAAFCQTVGCVAYEYHVSGLCATHTIADKDARANPSGWTSCLLETDAPTKAPTQGSEAPECPPGFHQVGDLSTNNDIGGWGMATRDEVHEFRAFESCVEMCENAPGCMAFNWNQAGTCVWYDNSVPNRDDGRGFMFCARDPETAAPTNLPTFMPTTSVPTEQPTFAPTTTTTTQTPTNLPPEVVQIPYDGPEYFCDTYQDPHIDTWHRAGSDWRDYRIDLASSDVPLHRGDWLIFEYGAYQVIMSHHTQTLWNTNIFIKKSGNIIYSYDGRTALRDINHAEVDVSTNPRNTWVSNVNYVGYGDRFEYELVVLRNIPLEIVWLQEKVYRDINNPSGAGGHGIILDIALKWNEDPLVTSGVCSSTKSTYTQFKLGDNVMTGRRELVEVQSETCPTLNQCCGRLAGLVNQFESCKQDNFGSCCASGADASTCCGSWVQAAPRCAPGSCADGEKCNLIDGYCYPEAQVAAVSAYKGSCHSTTDHNLDLAICSMDSGTLQCNQVINTNECDNGIAYLSKTIGGVAGETTFYDSCEFEWYAEYSCTPPVLACPSGYIQVGEFGADIAGCGLEGCLDIDNIADCEAVCEANADCFAFTFARPQEEMNNRFSCTLYDAVVPTRLDGHKIFCKSSNAPSVGTVTFEPKFDFVNTKCDEFLTPLKQVVARVSRSELRLVSAQVKDCKSGSFVVNIDVESEAAIEPLRQTVESDVFLQRLNHELQTHGKTEARSLENVTTSTESDGVALQYVMIVGALVLIVGVGIGFLCNRYCDSKYEESFDPEMGGEKRLPEFVPEISLKSIHDGISNNSSHTMYVDTLQTRTLRDGVSSDMLETNWTGEAAKQL